MGALPRPTVPGGPGKALFDELHELHHRAGWPSLREMAREVGCSHTTVSAAFSEPRVPRWGLLELIVEMLGGDTARFHRLWLAASSPDQSPPAAPPPPAGLPEPPRQLPADVVAFTGRADELREADRVLERAGTAAAAISVISGTAGVGKTALAVHWAHRLSTRFPDGQLYVDLRGYDPGRPLQATEALEGFLRGLGVPDRAIPQEPHERAARYRTLLANRRMLILLDNAHSVDQVRDLLPGTGSCFVIVTSRHTLPGLVARHGAARINLDLLPAADAVGLLRTLIGVRVDAEARSAAALAERCARLPLALRLAAELAISRPAAPLADLLAELEAEPLELFAAGEDEYTAVRAVFSWSCRHISPLAEHAFQLLGVHPGRDFDVGATAALVDTDPVTARRLLGELARVRLVDRIAAGRFGMHDLLRAYAAERAAGLAKADRWAALGRLVDHYVTAAAVAVGRRDGDGRAWLDAERPNLLAVAEATVDHFPAQIRRLSTTLAGYFDGRAWYADALALHRMAHQAALAAEDHAAAAEALNLLGTVHRRLGQYNEAKDAHDQALAIHRRTGDRVGEANAQHGLGILCWRTGQYRKAREHLERALALHGEVGNRCGEGNVLYALGIAARRLGRYAEAVDYHERSAAILREVGDRVGEGRALGNLGVVYQFLGRYEEALEHHGRALTIHRELDDRVGVAVVLTNLATAYERLGRYAEALRRHGEALEICHEVGYRVGEADALHGLGKVYDRLGRPDDALHHLERAVEIGREVGEADIQAAALTDLGEALRAAGRPAEAMNRLRSALAIAERTEDRYEQARALAGIAALRHDAGETTGADQYWRQALDIYTDLGLPEAHDIRHHLHEPDMRPAH